MGSISENKANLFRRTASFADGPPETKEIPNMRGSKK
jgi:hypothetical protein